VNRPPPEKVRYALPVTLASGGLYRLGMDGSV
jgi:hypothetical protein